MSKVHTKEQTKVVAVTIELTPDEGRALQRALSDARVYRDQKQQQYGQLQALGGQYVGGAGSLGAYLAPNDGLNDLRTQLQQALDGKN